MTTNATRAKAKSTSRAKKTADETLETVVKAGTENVTKSFEKAISETKERVEAAMKNFPDFSEVAKENVDAFVSAGTAAAKGAEAINAEFMAMSKRGMDDAAAAAKSLSTAKTAKDFFELQSDLMRSSWDAMVSETTKIGEMMTQYSKDVAAPISERVTANVEKISKPLSA